MSPLLTHRRSRRRSRAGRLVRAGLRSRRGRRPHRRRGPHRIPIRAVQRQCEPLVRRPGDRARRAVQRHRRLPAPAHGSDAGSEVARPFWPELDDVTAQAADQAARAAVLSTQRQHRSPVRHRVRGSCPVRRRGAVGHRRPARPAPPARGRRAGGPGHGGGHSGVAVVHPGHGSHRRRRAPPHRGRSELPGGAPLPGRHGGARPASRVPLDHHARHLADRRPDDPGRSHRRLDDPGRHPSARPECGPDHPARSPVPERSGTRRGSRCSRPPRRWC